MIAPRKKKFIKLIIMAWSVVLVITGSALPVFASPVTDDQGNFSPSSYMIQWYVYNPDSQSFSYVSVDSSVSIDGLTFTFPYAVYGVEYLRMYLYSSELIPVRSISVSGYVSFKPSSGNTYFVDLDSNSTVRFRGTGGASSDSYAFSGNPFSFSISPIDFYASNIVFLFDVSEVSGTFTVTFDSLVLNDIDISSSVSVGKINDLDDSTEDLDDSVEALETALPLPTFDASAFASAEAIADDYTFFNDGLRFTFMESDLVTHIFILVVYFTCLSIAIFGHAGG